MSKQPCKQCGTKNCGHKRHGRLIAATRFTSAHQRMATLHHTREHRQRIGARGFAALASKRGMQYAAEQLARYRRANPSGIEQIVIGWLDALGETYLHDRPFMGYLIYPDLQLPHRRLVIECDGKGFHGVDATRWLGAADDRATHDAYKDSIYAREGYTVLRLPEAAIRDGSARQMLMQSLGVKP